MYTPQHFQETRRDVLHSLIQQHPLASVVSRCHDDLHANHIPLLLVEGNTDQPRLQGHVARGNELLQDIASHSEVLVIFQGAQSYISPSWYPEKALTGKVVPTWNYLAVHVYGKLRTHESPQWLRKHLAQLTATQEQAFATPWQIDDAPDDYITRMLRGIVGIEIEIDRMLGKWKLSQNKTSADIAYIRAGLRERKRPDASATAEAMGDTSASDV